MPAYAALRRQTRTRGQKRDFGSSSASNVGSAPPPHPTVQQQLRLVNGVSLMSSSGEKEGSSEVLDPARVAMSMLKEEDHVWTIETCMETINLLRARNNELKAELLDVDTNFHDHVEARQRMIKELTQRADELAHAKEQLEATLESERTEQRCREKELARERDTETEAFQTTIKHLTQEVESLQAFAGERDKFNQAIAKIQAENEELKDQQEQKFQALRKQVAVQKAATEGEVQRRVAEKQANLREEVEISFAGEYETLVKENGMLKEEVRKLDRKLQALLSELVGQVSATEGLRRELDIVQDLENKSSGKLKYYMRMLKRCAAEGRFDVDLGEDIPVAGGKRHHSDDKQIAKHARRPETAPPKVCGAQKGQEGGPTEMKNYVLPSGCAKQAAHHNLITGDVGRCQRCGAATYSRSQSAKPSRCPVPPRRRRSHRTGGGQGDKKNTCNRSQRVWQDQDIKDGGERARDLDSNNHYNNCNKNNKNNTSSPNPSIPTTTLDERSHEYLEPENIFSMGGQTEVEADDERDRDVGMCMAAEQREIRTRRRRSGAQESRAAAMTIKVPVQVRVRPVTSDGIRNPSPRRPSSENKGKRVNSRSCEVTGQLRGNKKDAHTTTGESAPAAAAAAAAVYRRRPSTSYNTVDDSDNQQGIRRPWTASATTSPIKRYMGPTGSSMRREGTAVRRPRQGRGRDFCSGGWLDDTEEACAPREGGGVLWGQPQRSPKSELLETLYGFDGQHYGPAEEGLGYASDGRDWHEETPMAGVSREEEHLLRELDNGESELLSPGSVAVESRAERIRAVLDGGVAHLAKKPLESVLCREQLGGVGTGRPTAPRPSELLEEETLAAAARATTVGRKMVVDPETDKKS